MTKRDLAHDLFQSYKTGFTKKKKVIEERTQTPGDPTLIANVLSDLIQQRDWDSGLAEGTFLVDLADFAIAQRTSPKTDVVQLDRAARQIRRTHRTQMERRRIVARRDLIAERGAHGRACTRGSRGGLRVGITNSGRCFIVIP